MFRNIHYGWFIVFAALLIIILDGLILYSFGIFMPYMNEAFEMSVATGSSLFSVRCLVMAFSLVLSGRLIDLYDPRIVIFSGGVIASLGMLLTAFVSEVWQLYLTYSVMVGLGYGSFYITSVTVISRWFEEKRSLAIGIATTGVPLSGLIFNTVVAWLVTSFGMNNALIAVAGIIAVFILSCFILRSYPSDMNLTPYGSHRSYDSSNTNNHNNNYSGESYYWKAKDAFMNPVFWLLYIIFWFGFNTFLIIVINLYNFSIDSGISEIAAAGAPTAIGLGSIIGRIFFSAYVTKFMSNTRILLTCYFFQAGSIVLILIYADVWILYLFGLFFGFFYSGCIPIFPTMLGNFYGLKELGTIFGLFGTGFSLAALTGPLLAGYLHDITGSYFLPFLIAALFCYIASFLTLVIKNPSEKQNRLYSRSY